MDNKKQKARFGFVDAVIIILILSVAAAITYLILLQNGNVKTDNEPRTVEYSVKLTAIKEEYRSALAAGNEVLIRLRTCRSVIYRISDGSRRSIMTAKPMKTGIFPFMPTAMSTMRMSR